MIVYGWSDVLRVYKADKNDNFSEVASISSSGAGHGGGFEIFYDKQTIVSSSQYIAELCIYHLSEDNNLTLLQTLTADVAGGVNGLPYSAYYGNSVVLSPSSKYLAISTNKFGGDATKNQVTVLKRTNPTDPESLFDLSTNVGQYLVTNTHSQRWWAYGICMSFGSDGTLVIGEPTQFNGKAHIIHFDPTFQKFKFPSEDIVTTVNQNVEHGFYGRSLELTIDNTVLAVEGQNAVTIRTRTCSPSDTPSPTMTPPDLNS